MEFHAVQSTAVASVTRTQQQPPVSDVSTTDAWSNRKFAITNNVWTWQGDTGLPFAIPPPAISWDLPAATDAQCKGDDRHTEYVKLVGLPFNCGVSAIRSFMSDLPLYPSGKNIFMIKDKMGKNVSSAMVRMTDEHAAKRAAWIKHKQYMGHRYIEVYHVGDEEVMKHQLPSYRNAIPAPEETPEVEPSNKRKNRSSRNRGGNSHNNSNSNSNSGTNHKNKPTVNRTTVTETSSNSSQSEDTSNNNSSITSSDASDTHSDDNCGVSLSSSESSPKSQQPPQQQPPSATTTTPTAGHPTPVTASALSQVYGNGQSKFYPESLNAVVRILEQAKQRKTMSLTTQQSPCVDG